MKSWKSYFIESSAPDPKDLVAPMWNSDNVETQEHFMVAFDRYKLCVELADRVSQRRGLANTFLLTLNTLIFTTVGVF